jgi:hypothetical protein
MTPLQAAKAHCANYQPDGSCLGMYYNDDLSVDWSRYEPKAKCVLHNMCDACPYFEETVLPQVLGSVNVAYFRALPEGTVTSIKNDQPVKRRCPDCKKRFLEPNKQYCRICANVRKRTSYRKSKRQSREMSKNSSLRDIGAEALTKRHLAGSHGSSGHLDFGKLTSVRQKGTNRL